jgi:probable HAF family extracellular repeat protein
MQENRKKGFFLRVAALVLAGVPAAAQAWTIEDLGDLAGGPSFSEAYGLNEAGDVVGYGTTAVTNEAFVWKRAAGMAPLARPAGFASCAANGINDGGLVVGKCDSAVQGKRSAMVWQAGQPREVAFNNTAAVPMSEALAVNNLGEVSGSYREQLGTTLLDQAFTWDTRISGGTARGVTPLPADLGGSGRGNAINAQGYIAGNAIRNTGPDMHQPWLWSPAIANSARAIAAVGVLPGATAKSGDARGINDLPNVVGLYDGRGFLWTPHVPGATTGTTLQLPIEPYDINNRGQVVGVSGGRAKLFDVAANAVTDLSALPEVAAAGWRALSLARAINDKGQIVGTGVNAAGEVHAFLLSPDAAQPRPLRPDPLRPDLLRDRIRVPVPR